MPWNRTTQQIHKRPDDHSQNDLTDAEWTIIEPMPPKRGRMGRPRGVDLRSVFDAGRYILSTGCRWRALPSGYPPFSTDRNHFYAWRRSGLLARIVHRLRDLARRCSGRSAEPTAAPVDSQSVRTTESGGPRGHHAGRKVKGRKRHLIVDADGTPIVMTVHTADIQDRDGAPDLIAKLLETVPTVCRLFADGGYAGPKLRERPEGMGLPDVIRIVEKPKNVKGFTVLYRRWVVERTFAWMGRCRRLSKDYERLSENSLAWAQLAACRFLLRRVARASTP